MLSKEISNGLTGKWHSSKDVKEVRKQATWVTWGRMVQRTGTPYANALRQTLIWHSQGTEAGVAEITGAKGRAQERWS